MLTRMRGFLAEQIGPSLGAADGVAQDFNWRP
jgi:hypothetical protein